MFSKSLLRPRTTMETGKGLQQWEGREEGDDMYDRGERLYGKKMYRRRLTNFEMGPQERTVHGRDGTGGHT